MPVAPSQGNLFCKGCWCSVIRIPLYAVCVAVCVERFHVLQKMVARYRYVRVSKYGSPASHLPQRQEGLIRSCNRGSSRVIQVG